MKNKKELFSVITSVLTLVALTFGATYAYFTASASGSENGVFVTSENFKLQLDVIGEYVGHPIIPTNDNDIMTAYNNNCTDSLNNGACLSYKINTLNIGSDQSLKGSVSFNVEGIANLSYMVLDSEKNIYQDITPIGDGGTYSLGNGFNLTTGVSKSLTLIIWLTNLNEPQDEEDAGGSFNASVTINSVSGDRLTGSIMGNYE